MNLKTINKMNQQLDGLIQDAHDQVASAYLTMTRPLEELDRGEALRQLDSAMNQLRMCQSQLKQVNLSVAGCDLDLLKISESISKLRRGSFDNTKSTAWDGYPNRVVDTPEPGTE